ncbi:BAG family molecular chaperone regulator [Sporobolomyces salmoneus]|uniref:BAG family molecular chaperone regulator n=1 Tax=Sporobolomyces salmoneus TaxID=183962 RepID=UPI0031787A89
MFHLNTVPSPFFPNYDYDSYSPFSTSPSYLPRSYDSYDLRRSQLEQALLARKQQERREAEAGAYLARQRQLERQAAIEEAIREERERRELEQALRYREEMIRKAREEERIKREYVDAMRAREAEIARRRKIREEAERRRRIEEAQTQTRQIDLPDLFRHLLAPPQQAESSKPVQDYSSQTAGPDLLRLFFDAPQTESSKPVPPPQAQQPSPTPTAEPSPSPAVDIPKNTTTEAPSSSSSSTSSSSSSTDEAATTVQRHFRRHLARRNALSKLSSLSSTFTDRQCSFEKPTSFVFQRQVPSSSSGTPPLEYGSANASFLSYEDFLVNLLSKIDAVESGGDRQVKRERKALVRSVEKELERLDGMRQRAWEVQLKADKEEKKEEVKEAEESKEIEIEVVDQAPHSTPSSPQLKPTDDTDTELDTLEPLLPSDQIESPSRQLTKEALSSLAVPPVHSTSSPPSDSGSSTTSSTLTISTDDSPMSELIEQVLKRAEKLGAEVEKLEAAELESGKKNEDETKKEEREEFVVV